MLEREKKIVTMQVIVVILFGMFLFVYYWTERPVLTIGLELVTWKYSPVVVRFLWNDEADRLSRQASGVTIFSVLNLWDFERRIRHMRTRITVATLSSVFPVFLYAPAGTISECRFFSRSCVKADWKSRFLKKPTYNFQQRLLGLKFKHVF